MAESLLILGEFRRALDDRFRLSIPPELLERLGPNGESLVLVKERPGCISLWNRDKWRQQLDSNIAVIESKLRANRLVRHASELQRFGRLLSTRHRDIQIAGRGRLSIPEGFREFLAVEPSTDVLVVGAAICIEIWNIEMWKACLDQQIPEFEDLIDKLAE